MLQRPRETRGMGLAGRFLQSLSKKRKGDLRSAVSAGSETPPSAVFGQALRIRVSDADLLSQVVLLYANDLTNLATVKDWPWVVTVVDLLWGEILATSVSYLGFLAGKWLQ